MLADFPFEMPPELRHLSTASARMYPEFVHELEDESRMKIDLRDKGALVFVTSAELDSARKLAEEMRLERAFRIVEGLSDLEPALDGPKACAHLTLLLLQERSVDPRHVTAAAIAAAKHRGIDFSSGNEVTELLIRGGKVEGVRTSKTQFSADKIINCAGAWSGQIGPISLPTRPVKGQMLCVVTPKKELVKHVVRTPDVYLIPRSDGRMLIGATQEEAGFDKRTIPETIQKLRNAALDLVPQLAEARFLEDWAGLRPGTPDNLPILGATAMPDYFVATGHFRDGILLAPITARIMAQVVVSEKPEFDLDPFAPGRFGN